MKRIVFLFFCAFFIYFAGMYHDPALMVIAVLQLLLLLFLTVQVYITRRYLKVRLSAESGVAVRGREFLCRISSEYRRKFPAGDIRFYIRCGYNNRKEFQPETGSRTGRDNRSLYARAETGETYFAAVPEYCGLMTVSLEQIRIYDRLFLGSVKKRSADSIQVPVFPQERALNIELLSTESSGLRKETVYIAYGNDGNSEIRQIREYREGDLKRQIHWNLSARMGGLWTREYEQEEDRRADVFLDLTGYDSAALPERDAFCMVLSALLLGLLHEMCQVKVCWYDEKKDGLQEAEVTDLSRCRALLAVLYRISGGRPGNGRTGQIRAAAKSDGIILDIELRIFQGNALVEQFTEENLAEELDKKKLTFR